jgi:hypothetical protein
MQKPSNAKKGSAGSAEKPGKSSGPKSEEKSPKEDKASAQVVQR